MAKKAKTETKKDADYVAVKGRLVHYNVNRLNRYDGMIGQPKIVTCMRIPVCRENKEEQNKKPSTPSLQSNRSTVSSPSSPPLSPDAPHYSVFHSCPSSSPQEEFSLITDYVSSLYRPRWSRYDEIRLRWLLSKESDMAISFSREVLSLFSFLFLRSQNRIKLFDWLIDVSVEFDVSTETTLLAVPSFLIIEF